MRVRWLWLCLLLAACGGREEAGLPTLDDKVLDRTLHGNGPIPVRQAIGVPDALYFCIPMDSSYWPEDLVDHLNDGYHAALPESQLKPPENGSYAYLVSPRGEQLMLISTERVLGRIPGEECVDARDGVFVRVRGDWVLRSGPKDVGSPEGWRLIEALKKASSPIAASKALGVKQLTKVCLGQFDELGRARWEMVADRVTPAGAERPKLPIAAHLDIPFYIATRDGKERYIALPGGEGVEPDSSSCVTGRTARFEKHGDNWVLAGEIP